MKQWNWTVQCSKQCKGQKLKNKDNIAFRVLSVKKVPWAFSHVKCENSPTFQGPRPHHQGVWCGCGSWLSHIYTCPGPVFGSMCELGTWSAIDMGQPASTTTSDTLMMGTEVVPETSSFYHLTWLIAREDFMFISVVKWTDDITVTMIFIYHICKTRTVSSEAKKMSS
jgi:hypothetical protein